jgi:outer membrane protein OmpA-like peptidoglycan-associated protein
MSEMLVKANGILDNGQQAIQSITRAASSLDSISGKIDRGDETVGALVNDKQLYRNLEESTNTLHDTMVQAQAGVSEFNENMEALKHNFLLRGYFKNRGYENSSDLAKNEIEQLPQSASIKEFTFSAKQLFEKQDSAKLKNQRSLTASGEYLVNNPFGVAVIVVSAGMEGDTQKDLAITEARAMVVREYLVGNFGFDDSQLKTLGMGKQPNKKPGDDWGTVRIFIYPAGTEIPRTKQNQVSILSPNSPIQPPQP